MIKHLILLKIWNIIDMKEVFNINVFDKKSSCVGVKNKNMLSQRSPDLACVAKVSDRKWELAEELYKPFIKKF